MATVKITWPHTITRGPLQGRTFPTQAAYDRARREYHASQNPTSGLRGDTVIRILDSYNELIQAGLGHRKAATILQRVFGA